MSQVLAASPSFDEKKEEHPSPKMTTAKTSALLSPSKQRAKTASAAGLSELSKQLRILQAKNEAQSVEINRLERQLKILAELQGISVADLRKALEDACANEAFDELQHRVKKLRFELEAATLAKQKEIGKDASAPHIANLELRIGELEEVEQRHQTEVMDLYDQLRHEKARATRLEAEGAQHQQDAQKYLEQLNQEMARASRLESSFQEQLQKHQMDQARKMQEMAKIAKEAEQAKRNRQLLQSDPDAASANASKDAMSGNGGDGATPKRSGSIMGGRDANGQSSAVWSPDMADEYQRMVQLLKDKDQALKEAEARLQAERERLMRELKDKEGQAMESHTNMQVDKDKMMLTIQQLQDGDSQNELRLAQFRARFAVQDERLTDMGQQLSSLYTAFGLLKEDQEAEDQKRRALQNNLNEADKELARHVDDDQKRKSRRNGSRRDVTESTSIIDPWDPAAQKAARAMNRTPSVPRTITTPPSAELTTAGYHSPISTNSRAVVATPSAVATPERVYTPPAGSTPSTWQLIFPEPRVTNTETYSSSVTPGENGLLIKGMLIVKSKSMMRKWKSKFSKLYVQGNHYQWDMEGKSYTLGFGISKVEFYPNHPLSFTVYTNPFDEMAPVVHAATATEEDYHRWMAALTKVTTGEEYEIPPNEGSPRRAHASLSTPHRYSSADSVVSGLSAEEQEAADLSRALYLSQAMT